MEFTVLCYFVILPHTYLMNTSHNKDRIIDEGLTNTIRNALAIPFDIKMVMRKLRQVSGVCFPGEDDVISLSNNVPDERAPTDNPSLNDNEANKNEISYGYL